MSTAVAEKKWLDPTKKQDVRYAVDFWLRDEQIRQAIKRVPGRIQKGEPRTGSIAVVCYGPSLNDTWQEIASFDHVISCSGAHKFLIERGIVPDWHVEVDPRAHKVKLIGEPHADVEYLIASTCHGAVFDHLKGQNVKLWHVFDTSEDALRTLPHGEWAITGGCSVGLRAMSLAVFLGFRDLHVFGMDGSEGATGKHAAEHPNQPSDHSLCEYNGQTYRTTASMLEAARSTAHELDQMPDVAVKFYGEGLCQAMMADYERKPPVGGSLPNIVGYCKEEVISSTYRQLNAQLHEENLAYGVGGGRHARMVLDIMSRAPSLKSVLDYGCGKGYLAKALDFPIYEYDPAITGKDESPRPADLVVCTDVLEHIEPDRLLYVLQDLQRVTRKVGYFVVHTGPSGKLLADGRNAHLIQEKASWWKVRLEKFFHVGKVIDHKPLVTFLLGPKVMKAKKKKKTAA